MGDGEGWTGNWGQQMHTITFRVDKQGGSNIYHNKLYSTSCDKQ